MNYYRIEYRWSDANGYRHTDWFYTVAEFAQQAVDRLRELAEEMNWKNLSIEWVHKSFTYGWEEVSWE